MSQATWEPFEHLKNVKELVDEYNQKNNVLGNRQKERAVSIRGLKEVVAYENMTIARIKHVKNAIVWIMRDKSELTTGTVVKRYPGT
jgi:hypothetical protein